MIAPTNLNESQPCVDSWRRWPLTWCKHLSIWSKEPLYQVEDYCEKPFVFTLPISLKQHAWSSWILEGFFPVIFACFLWWMWTDSPLGRSHCKVSEERLLCHNTLSVLTLSKPCSGWGQSMLQCILHFGYVHKLRQSGKAGWWESWNNWSTGSFASP